MGYLTIYTRCSWYVELGCCSLSPQSFPSISILSLKTFGSFKTLGQVFAWLDLRQGVRCPGWPQLPCVARLDLEFLIVLPPPPECWHSGCASPCQVEEMLVTKPRVLCMPDKDSTSRATSQALSLQFQRLGGFVSSQAHTGPTEPVDWGPIGAGHSQLCKVAHSEEALPKINSLYTSQSDGGFLGDLQVCP